MVEGGANEEGRERATYMYCASQVFYQMKTFDLHDPNLLFAHLIVSSTRWQIMCVLFSLMVLLFIHRLNCCSQKDQRHTGVCAVCECLVLYSFIDVSQWNIWCMCECVCVCVHVYIQSSNKLVKINHLLWMCFLLFLLLFCNPFILCWEQRTWTEYQLCCFECIASGILNH